MPGSAGRCNGPNRERRYLAYNGKPLLDEAGELVGYRGVGRDETAEKRAQAALVHARDAAEAAAHAKSQFLANMSHEIRTPMNGVIGMTDLLLETPLSSDQAGLAEVIRDSSTLLIRVIEDILDFSKIESGMLRLSAAPFDLESLVRNVATLLSSLATGKGIAVVVDYPEIEPRRFIGDADRLRQILVDLGGIAVKFTSEGTVTIRVRRAEGAALELAVLDTGIGTPDSALERVFQAFYRVDGSSTRRHGGTGLGLAITRNIVALMGGRIEVTSAPDVGTTVRVVLPLPLAVDAETPGAMRAAS